MTLETFGRAHDPVGPPDPDAWVWDPLGWECAHEESVQDARDRSRGEAHHRFAHGYCEWAEVGVWKRYARPLTRAEAWEHAHDLSDPGLPPDSWEPDGGCPVWTFCRRSEGVPVWVCGLRENGPPSRPARSIAEAVTT